MKVLHAGMWSHSCLGELAQRKQHLILNIPSSHGVCLVEKQILTCPEMHHSCRGKFMKPEYEPLGKSSPGFQTEQISSGRSGKRTRNCSGFLCRDTFLFTMAL